MRFIPAGAGNTKWFGSRRMDQSVHPRGCGEHGPSPYQLVDATGSSPRVRGTRCHCRNGRPAVRFIPAGAGNTVTHHSPRRPRPVHPRGCGEHVGRPGQIPRPPGRFIPAGAGNTFLNLPLGVWRAVHPRGCGEHGRHDNRGCRVFGSSPRVRGTLLLESIDLTVEFQRAESYRKFGGFRRADWRVAQGAAAGKKNPS